ncbi:MAG: ThuA domain-containing protein [Gammaproteobacteria bacterium]
MTVAPINGYLVCGGLYHDMDYARVELLKLLGEHERIRVRVGEDYRDASAIAAADFLVTYTCDVIPDEAQLESLQSFLSGGRRWLALHGTNSVLRFLKGRGWDAPRTTPEFMAMLGSQFIAHPPIKPYLVEVSDASHPLVAGIDAFNADDELYLSQYHGNCHALLHTHYRGEAPGFVARFWPDGAIAAQDGNDTPSDRQLVMYLHPHAGGEVLYCTLGHCRGKYDMRPMMAEYPTLERGSWKLPVYHELLRRGIRWAAGLPN